MENDNACKAASAVHASKIRDTGLAITNGISRTGSELKNLRGIDSGISQENTWVITALVSLITLLMVCSKIMYMKGKFSRTAKHSSSV